MRIEYQRYLKSKSIRSSLEDEGEKNEKINFSNFNSNFRSINNGGTIITIQWLNMV